MSVPIQLIRTMTKKKSISIESEVTKCSFKDGSAAVRSAFPPVLGF